MSPACKLVLEAAEVLVADFVMREQEWQENYAHSLFSFEIEESCYESLWVFLQPSEKKQLAPLHRKNLHLWTWEFSWAFHFIARTFALLKCSLRV